jgi:hypothetical protein
LEEVVLLLAEGTGGAKCLEVYQTRDVRSLRSVDTATWTSHLPNGDDKWTHTLVDRNALEIYRTITTTRFERLDDWGGAYLGAVTGNNKFFSLTAAEVAELGLSKDDVIRISAPGTRHLRGLTFTEAEWGKLNSDGARGYLLHPKNEPSGSALKYIATGENIGVSKAYKCRVRKPWWRVPLVDTPDLLLTYMNHDRPRLVSNSARVHILNSLYGVRLTSGRKQLGRDLLPIACLNSITLLGSEIVGRAYGGGLLKMEPKEANQLPLPSRDQIRAAEKELRGIKPQLSQYLCQNKLNEAVKAVDSILLPELTERDLSALRRARDILFQRRRARSKNGEN